MYKLVKIKLEAVGSQVALGHVEIGNLLMVFDNDNINTEARLKDVKVDTQVYLQGYFSFVRTSPISKIISSDDKKVVFKTTSSTYELSVVEDV